MVFSPTKLNPLRVRVVVPTLDSVTDWLALVVVTSWAPNVSAAVLKLTAVPVPLSGTFNVGFTRASLLITRVVLRAPAAVGLNVTLITQLVLVAGGTGFANPVPQLLNDTKSIAFPFTVPMLAIVSASCRC